MHFGSVHPRVEKLKGNSAFSSIIELKINQVREAIKVEKKKSVTFVRGHCHTFYFMLKMAYNSSRNAKKFLGANQKKKCDECHTFFFFSTLMAPLSLVFFTPLPTI